MKCHGKHRFATLEAASDSAALINGSERSKRTRGQPLMRPYQCGVCDGFHLTSKPSKNDRISRRRRAA